MYRDKMRCVELNDVVWMNSVGAWDVAVATFAIPISHLFHTFESGLSFYFACLVT